MKPISSYIDQDTGLTINVYPSRPVSRKTRSRKILTVAERNAAYSARNMKQALTMDAYDANVKFALEQEEFKNSDFQEEENFTVALKMARAAFNRRLHAKGE